MGGIGGSHASPLGVGGAQHCGGLPYQVTLMDGQGTRRNTTGQFIPTPLKELPFQVSTLECLEIHRRELDSNTIDIFLTFRMKDGN